MAALHFTQFAALETARQVDFGVPRTNRRGGMLNTQIPRAISPSPMTSVAGAATVSPRTRPTIPSCRGICPSTLLHRPWKIHTPPIKRPGNPGRQYTVDFIPGSLSGGQHKGWRGVECHPDPGEQPVRRGLESYPAPEVTSIDEPLTIESRRPEGREQPGGPGCGAGPFEQHRRIKQTGQAHPDQQQAVKEGMNLEDVFAHRGQAAVSSRQRR